MKYTDQFIGGLTPEQRKRMNGYLEQLRQHENRQAAAGTTPAQAGSSGGPIAVQSRAVVGQNKRNPMISFYAAAIGVMFLLFTASGSAGALLDEAESGTLDRVLSSRVTMTTLLMGKLTLQHAAGVYATDGDVSLGLGSLQTRSLHAYSRLCGDGPVHRLCRGRLWHVAGQHLPHAGAVGRALHAAHSHHVRRRRQHVSPLS